MSIPELLFQYTSTIKISLSILIKYKADVIIISLNHYSDSESTSLCCFFAMFWSSNTYQLYSPRLFIERTSSIYWGVLASFRFPQEASAWNLLYKKKGRLNVTCSLSSWYSWKIAHFCIIYNNYLFIYCSIQNLCVYVNNAATLIFIYLQMWTLELSLWPWQWLIMISF
jgi:hypothetical protein